MRGHIARMFVATPLVICIACGGSTQSATSPTSPSTPISGSEPIVRFEIKVDDQSARDAVALISDIIVDASASTGTGSLAFAIDYGDGFSATSPTAHHAYTAAGTYTITAMVTDGQARKASQTRQITVQSLVGSWFEAEYVQKSKRVEIRRLTVTAQDGLTIRGQYQLTGAADRAFSGTLAAPRNVWILLDGGATLEGVIPGRLNDETEHWILQAHGDTVDGERLEFRPIVGDPPAAPDADFTVRFDEDDLPWPIAGISPIQVDATRSRGSGLTYFIEFGDGFAVSSSSAGHIVDGGDTPHLAVRVTVVDRFGRSDAESANYFLFELGVGNSADGGFWEGEENGNSRGWLQVIFRQRTGMNYVGTALQTECGGVPIDCRQRTATVNATLSGTRSVRMALPELNATYSGTVEMVKSGPGSIRVKMDLQQSGGERDGKRWTVWFRDYY